MKSGPDQSLELHSFKNIELLTHEKSAEKVIHAIEEGRHLFEPIGEGGNAEVFALRESGLELSHVCLKEIKDQPVLKGNDLLAEAKIQNDAHDFGVRTPLVYSIVESNEGKRYFLMERIFGASLEDFAKDQKKKLPENITPESFTKDFRKQVDEMHKAGIVHRDLRSANVMINTKGEVVIIDFGVAAKGYSPDSARSSELPYEETVMMWDPAQEKYLMKNGYFVNDLESVSLAEKTLRSVLYRGIPTSFDQFGQPR